MGTTDRSRPNRRLRPLALAALVSLATLGAGACSGDSTPVLSGDAAQGKQVARDKNCSSCHTADGGRSEGPTWKGLAGSTVKLADGSSVVADDAYLARSITDPRAQVVQGYRTAMPVTPNLTDADVKALIAYINALK
jgi:cytochrome c oxidase subunit 2